MHVKSIIIGSLSIPLIRPFITAVRRTDSVEDIVVQIITNTGHIGYGNAAITPLITGDSRESIICTIKDIIAPLLIGQKITPDSGPSSNFNHLFELINTSIPKNTSAKAALDIALHDLFAQARNLPLYQLLGGTQNEIRTGITISAKSTDEMVNDAKALVAQGFTTIKIKVGLYAATDIERIKALCNAIGDSAKIMIDANQGWGVNSAIKIMRELEALNLNLEFIEQPVIASDLNGLKLVHDSVNSCIMADEACFSPQDASTLAKNRACDGVNIKLMKSGGIYNANAIYNIAKNANLKVMVGCM